MQQNVSQVLAISFLAFSLSLARAADWPCWRGPDRTGISRESAWSHDWPDNGPKKLWKASVGTGFSSMVISEGRLHTMGNDGMHDSVFCLNAVTGETNWVHSYEQPLVNKMYEGGPNSTPLVDGGKVFTASRTGKIHCLDSLSGKVIWMTDLGKQINADFSDWGLSAAPVLEDGRLLITYGPAGAALDPATGKTLWNSGKKKAMGFAPPATTKLSGQPAALFFMSEDLIAVDPSSGTKLWSSPFGAGYRTHCSDPIIAGNRVFISSCDDGGELLELTSKGAKRIWKNKNLSTFTGTAVLIDGHLYGHDTAGYKEELQELRCVDLETGTVKWGLKGFGQGSVIASDHRLIVMGASGEVAVVKASPLKAEVLARAHLIGGKCWTTPALANEKLYLRNAKGEVACFDLSGKKTASK